MNNNNMNMMNNNNIKMMNNMNNMNMMNNMNNMNTPNNCSIINDLNTKFMGLSMNQQKNINSAFNLLSSQSTMDSSSNSLLNSVDSNKEITIIFRFLTGQNQKVKGKLKEKFHDVFKRFHDEECPKELKPYMCYALHNSKPLDNNKNLFENNIKNNDTVLFIKIDENYKEEDEKEEEEEEEENEEDEEEKNKVIESWIEEYKCIMILNLIGKLILSNEEEDVKINLESKEFFKFITEKFRKIGMKVEEHEHKLVYSKTNLDWECNECESEKSKKEPRLFCSICNYNMCNECRREKEYYKIGSIPLNATPHNKNVKTLFVKHKGHEHQLAFCRTKRTAGHGGWLCNICKKEYDNKTWTFYCTECDYDLCDKCAKKEKLI
jgi:hypothetical protein